MSTARALCVCSFAIFDATESQGSPGQGHGPRRSGECNGAESRPLSTVSAGTRRDKEERKHGRVGKQHRTFPASAEPDRPLLSEALECRNRGERDRTKPSTGGESPGGVHAAGAEIGSGIGQHGVARCVGVRRVDCRAQDGGPRRGAAGARALG